MWQLLSFTVDSQYQFLTIFKLNNSTQKSWNIIAHLLLYVFILITISYELSFFPFLTVGQKLLVFMCFISNLYQIWLNKSIVQKKTIQYSFSLKNWSLQNQVLTKVISSYWLCICRMCTTKLNVKLYKNMYRRHSNIPPVSLVYFSTLSMYAQGLSQRLKRRSCLWRSCCVAGAARPLWARRPCDFWRLLRWPPFRAGDHPDAALGQWALTVPLLLPAHAACVTPKGAFCLERRPGVWEGRRVCLTMWPASCVLTLVLQCWARSTAEAGIWLWVLVLRFDWTEWEIPGVLEN